jgi:hypothetical protein
MRLKCKAFGCLMDDYGDCVRCEANTYHGPGPHGPFLERGWLTWLHLLYWNVRHWAWPRCQVCRRFMWPWQPRRYCCSDACFRKWIPF